MSKRSPSAEGETSATRASVKRPRFSDALAPGDLVQISSDGAQTWTTGRIAEILDGEKMLVEYYAGDGFGIEAETVGENAEFIISFSTGNKRDNERRLWHLQRKGAQSVLWGNGLKTITFCTSRSLGTSVHFVGTECDANYKGRANGKYDYLGLPDVREPEEEIGGFPSWFEIYRTAAMQTRYGVLILNFTPEYLRSKACRWEFRCIPTDRVFVYIASRNLIVPLSSLKDDAELIMSAFESSDPDSSRGFDSEEAARAIAEEIDELVKIAENKDDGSNIDAWCALPMYEIMHTFARKQWGREHIRTIRARELVATSLTETGKPGVAKRILMKQLKMKERLRLEPNEVAKTLVNLGNAYSALGDVEMKKQLLQRALQIQERHHGREHYQLASTLLNLGGVYGDLGEVGMQKQILERALQIQERHCGHVHYQLASTLTDLALVYGCLGEFDMAKQLFERALQIQERHYGREHYQLASTLKGIGGAHVGLGDMDTAKQLFERALQTQERHYGHAHYLVAEALYDLGFAYHASGDAVTAKQLLQRALLIQERHYGLEHYELASTLNKLGHAHGDLGEFGMQKQLSERALQIQERHYGREHYRLDSTLNNLGTAYCNLGDVDMAKQLLERALQIQERHYGREHEALASTLRNLVRVSCAGDDLEMTKRLLERLLGIQERHYGSEDGEVAQTREALGWVYGALVLIQFCRTPF